jgi:hypothetical protein
MRFFLIDHSKDKIRFQLKLRETTVDEQNSSTIEESNADDDEVITRQLSPLVLVDTTVVSLSFS